MITNSSIWDGDTCISLTEDGFGFDELAKGSVGHIFDKEEKIMSILECGDKISEEGMVQILHDIFFVYNHICYAFIW